MKPSLFRAIAFGILIIGVLFKIQHWPGANVILVIAWGLALLVLVARPLIKKAIVPREAMRGLFTLGLLSVMVIRMLHLPGRGFALGVTILGGLGVLWYDRGRILPGKGDRGTMPWLFYLALAMTLIGTMFRILHWPYGTALLLGGLALAALWFFWSMRSKDNA